MVLFLLLQFYLILHMDLVLHKKNHFHQFLLDYLFEICQKLLIHLDFHDQFLWYYHRFYLLLYDYYIYLILEITIHLLRLTNKKKKMSLHYLLNDIAKHTCWLNKVLLFFISRSIDSFSWHWKQIVEFSSYSMPHVWHRWIVVNVDSSGVIDFSASSGLIIIITKKKKRRQHLMNQGRFYRAIFRLI